MEVLTIQPDYDFFIIDENGYVWNYDELDELCEKPVQIHGLKEWCKEIVPVVIEGAVGREFPKDWADYHRRGLELARKLREVLPEKYELWYEAPVEDKSGTIEKPVLIVRDNNSEAAKE